VWRGFYRGEEGATGVIGVLRGAGEGTDVRGTVHFWRKRRSGRNSTGTGGILLTGSRINGCIRYRKWGLRL
jgi:hypothetical protein